MDRKALFFLYKGWYIYCTRLKWLHILISSFYIVMLLIGFRINSKIFKSCLFLFRRKHLDNLFHFINGGRIFLKTKIVAAQSNYPKSSNYRKMAYIFNQIIEYE